MYVSIYKDGVLMIGSTLPFYFDECIYSINPTSGCMDQSRSMNIYVTLPSQFTSIFCMLRGVIVSNLDFVSNGYYTCQLPPTNSSGYFDFRIGMNINGTVVVSSAIYLYFQDCGVSMFVKFHL